jgi:hypothetical protein
MMFVATLLAGTAPNVAAQDFSSLLGFAMQARMLPVSLRSLSLVVTVVAVVSFPAAAGAQGDGQPVVAGLTLSVTEPRGVDTVVYQRSITRAGKDTSAGTRTVISRVSDAPDHTRVLEVEQRFPAGGGEIVDTAVAELSTMRAVAHRSHQPTKTMRFDFAGGNADGIVRPTAATDTATASLTVHQSLGGAIFDSNVIDVVVASLPLAAGFSTELPFFIYERGGRVVMPVTVRERATVRFPTLGDRDAWVVTVGVPGAPATIWVDARTRAVLRVRYDIAARGMSFTDERITPLRS